MRTSLAPPSFAFLVAHPAHFVALGFGAGLSPVMPGTVGTLVAFPIAWLLQAHADTLGFLAAIAVITVTGAFAAEVTGRHLGAADHGAIVIDEIAAFLLVLFFAGSGALQQVVAFVLFRIFDIAKPPPIRQVDQSVHGGIGVMADDFIAAGYALLVLAIAQRLIFE
ncbi:MAG TPA: phosphatidylglycerophosphatase A [Casimicrobiaceae bacterium]|nr:phosphatidylglycerophosphatase A [Casimicrobiaceae bacterium]